MPIVMIRTHGPIDVDRMEAVSARVSRELAAAIGSVPENVWAHFSPMWGLREGLHAPEPSTYHPVVTVLANPRPEEEIRRGLRAVGEAVAAGIGVRVEQVWVHWVDLPPGRVLAGGEVR